ncbi:MAG: osmotically inducible protein OsmC [Candidatus Marinimicrobia bacterium]|nr:osmotically inducible protein OsmC [Candidatus Neomarinimicrobiota bacterium]
MIAQVEYKGQLRTEAKHLRSGRVIVTDAPIDNQGKGEAFSPTDLVATALASCMITIMGIVAERDGIDIEGVTADVDKIMSKEPRRIGEIKIIITFKSKLTTDQRGKLERAAKTCPVSGSLHEDLKETIEFSYA